MVEAAFLAGPSHLGHGDRGMTPMTFTEMYDQVLAHFIDNRGLDPDEARQRAWRSVCRLVDEGYVELWGMSADGLPVYQPAVVRAIVTVYRRDE